LELRRLQAEVAAAAHSESMGFAFPSEGVEELSALPGAEFAAGVTDPASRRCLGGGLTKEIP
jgi:hypothetical protein